MQRVTITPMQYHMRYHTFYLSLPSFRATIRYREIYKKSIIMFFKINMVTHGNPLQTAHRKYMVTRKVTR